MHLPKNERGAILVPIIIGVLVLVGVISVATIIVNPKAQNSYQRGLEQGKDSTSQKSNISPTPTPKPTTAATSTPKPTQTPTATTPQEITYEVVKRWSQPDGGEGKLILISPDYLNEADMTALGEKLKSDTKKDKNAFIWIFTDRRAIEMRDEAFADELKGKDLDFYDKHYVGQYTKNGNTGFHEYTIYFDGVSGTNDKTIKY